MLLMEDIGLLLEIRENVLNSFKSNFFSMENLRPKQTPNATPNTQTNKNAVIDTSQFRWNKNCIKEIRNDEGTENRKMFSKYSKYQILSFLFKDLPRPIRLKIIE